MKLYHGSKRTIEKPNFMGSKVDNDYGPAFYCTKEKDLAHEWACRNNSIGYVNIYELRIENLKILDLTNKEKYSPLNWIAILMHFRSLGTNFAKFHKPELDYLEEHFYIDISQYDIVIGYRADDAYFRFPLEFIESRITLKQLENAFELGDLGIQYVLVSEKAISKLKYVGSEKSEVKHLNKYFERVSKATEAFDKYPRDLNGTTFLDIVRGK